MPESLSSPAATAQPAALAASSRFPHESLDAYAVAREVVALVASRRARLHGMPGELRSHLERSSVSAMLNVAEAAARSGKDRASRFAIARAECCEAAAAAEAVHLFGGLSPKEYQSLRRLLERLAQMLTRLARAPGR